MGSYMWHLIKKSAMAAAFAICFSDKIGSVAMTQGSSMQPTLKPGTNELFGFFKGDIVYVDKFSSSVYRFTRGDVVVLRSPEDPNELLVKRLLALQGDWINVPGSYEIVQIPMGRCWVEGDHANVSRDSTTFGPIPLALLKGKVTHKIWPLSRVGRVENFLPSGRVMISDTTPGRGHA